MAGLFQQFGLDFDPEAEVRKRRQEGVQQSLKLIEGVSGNSGVQGAANIGAMLGAGLVAPKLTPQQQAIQQIQEGTKARAMQWEKDNPNASEEDKAFALQDIAATEAVRAGRSDIGSEMFQQVAERKRAREIQQKNLEMLGHQIRGAKANADEAGRGDMHTVWVRGEEDPNKSFTVAIDPEDGSAVDSSTGKIYRPGEYTFEKPLDPERSAVARAQIAALRAANSGTGGVVGTLGQDGIDLAAEVYLKTFRLPPGMGTVSALEKATIIKRAAEMAKERGLDSQAAVLDKFTYAADQAARAATLKNFSTGVEGRTVRSFNVAIQHIDQLGGLIQALQNGNVQGVNKVANSISKWFGSVPPSSFEGVKKIVADELVKAILGSGGGALMDRQEVEATLRDSKTMPQLMDQVAQFKGLMAGQMNGLRKQYEFGTKRMDFEDTLLPETVAQMRAHGMADTAAQMPPEIRARLKEGEELTLRNGTWTLRNGKPYKVR